MKNTYSIDRNTRNRIAAEGCLDLRSVERVLRGEEVYMTTFTRVINVMTRLGLEQHIPSSLNSQKGDKG